MNHSMPDLPVHHQLPEFTQTHVHRVGDAIQPSHPLSSPSAPAPNPSSIRVFSNESTLRMAQRSLMAQPAIKNPPAMWETWVWSLGWEDPLEKQMATHSSILAWRIPWTEEPGRLQPMRSQSWRLLWFSFSLFVVSEGFPGGASGKEPTCQCRRHRDVGLIPGSGRSPGEGNGNPLQCSCLENLMDREAWQTIVHRVAKSDTTEAT